MALKKLILAAIGASVAAAAPTGNECNNRVPMYRTTLQTIPGGIEYEVVYPAIFDLTQETTYIGSHDIERYVHAGLEACPGQVHALLGYSQGATVVLEVLRAFTGRSAEDAVKAVVFIGNPYQVKGQSTTVDEKGGASTRDKDGILLPLKRDIGLSQHWVDSGKPLNICNSGDAVCKGISITALNPNHLLYGFTPGVQKLGSDHLISKLQ